MPAVRDSTVVREPGGAVLLFSTHHFPARLRPLLLALQPRAE
jgi:hypothetical protein